ncbi:MAG: OmpH family outer membrane protein [Mediterranea sp.]|jgi:outer membrane protein|nr:OmpH family outer membrane protein [Mediterranea sp.]
MKKSVLLMMLMLAVATVASAQKFALIDTEYIMKNIPAAQSANDQMQQATKKYQGEVEAKTKEVQALYQDYQAKLHSLSTVQKTQKEDAIVAKEKEAADLRKKYFGPDGELAKLNDKLMGPIKDEVYEAVKELAERHGYDLILDRATASEVIFANPRIDISDEVLQKLGYSN